MIKSNITDIQKLWAFQLYLKLGSVAKQWWNNLPTSDKYTWEHHVQAFKKRWPDKATTVKTVEEKQAALEQMKIMEEEVEEQWSRGIHPCYMGGQDRTPSSGDSRYKQPLDRQCTEDHAKGIAEGNGDTLTV